MKGVFRCPCHLYPVDWNCLVLSVSHEEGECRQRGGNERAGEAVFCRFFLPCSDLTHCVIVVTMTSLKTLELDYAALQKLP